MDNKNPLQHGTKRKAAGILSGFIKILNAAYYAAFAFCVGWVFVKDSTMFSKIISDEAKAGMDGYYHLAAGILLICAVQTLLLQDNIRLACFGAILIIVGYIQYAIGGHKFSYYVLCLMIAGAAGKSFKKILTVWIVVDSLIMAAAVFASQAGIIEDLIYSGTRHSYGIVYCTDCAAHVLFLMTSYAVLRLPRFRLRDYAVLVLGLVFMLGTGGKTNIIGGCLLTGGIFIADFLRTKRVRAFISGGLVRRAARVSGALMCFSFPACAAFSFVSPMILGKNIPEPEGERRLMNSTMKRLQISYRALHENPFSLFGKKIKEHSLGGKTTHPDGWWKDKYFFIDNSYLRLYILGGVILFILFLVVLTYAQVRCYFAEQYRLEYFILLLALVCVFEHHLVDYVFQIFPLLAFSRLDIPQKTRRHRKRMVRGE